MKQYTNEQEILDALERQAFLIEQNLNKNVITLQEFNTELPESVAVVTHSLGNFLPPIYFGKKSLDMANISQKEYLQNPLESIKSNNSPGNYEKHSKLVVNHLSGDKQNLPVSYIQKVKLYNGVKYEGLFTFSKKNQKSAELISIYIPVNILINVSPKMLRILEDSMYMRNNYHKFASLTTREKEIITLLALGLQNNEIGKQLFIAKSTVEQHRKNLKRKTENEIAEQLFISKSTVEQHRKNLKRKLEIKHFVDLIRFAQSFDLI